MASRWPPAYCGTIEVAKRMLLAGGLPQDDLFAPRLTAASHAVKGRKKEVSAQFASPRNLPDGKPSSFQGLFAAENVFVVDADLKRHGAGPVTLDVELIIVAGFVAERKDAQGGGGVARRLMFTGMPVHMSADKPQERMVVLPPTYEGDKYGGRHRWYFEFPLPDSLFNPAVSDEQRFLDFEQMMQTYDGGFLTSLESMSQAIANACKHGDRIAADVVYVAEGGESKSGKKKSRVKADSCVYEHFVPAGAFDLTHDVFARDHETRGDFEERDQHAFGELMRKGKVAFEPADSEYRGNSKRGCDYFTSLVAVRIPQGNIATLMSVFLDTMIPGSMRSAFNFDATTSLTAGNVIMSAFAKASIEGGRRLPVVVEEDAGFGLVSSDMTVVNFPAHDDPVDLSLSDSIFTSLPAPVEQSKRGSRIATKIVLDKEWIWPPPSAVFHNALRESAISSQSRQLACAGFYGTRLSSGSVCLGKNIVEGWRKRRAEAEMGNFLLGPPSKMLKTGSSDDASQGRIVEETEETEEPLE